MAAADDPHRIALVLTGGGARAAYQVGVLQAVSDLLGRPRANPFPIVCGTSAGAINAAALAIGADDFTRAVTWLVDEWRSFHAERVYRTDLASLTRLGLRWLGVLTPLHRNVPISLLDNTPLRELVETTLDLERIANHIASGALEAISITASGYASGRSVAFYQGGPKHVDWERSHRVGVAAPITHDVLMASTAIPFLFPAVKVDAEHFGDGSMRQIAPVSPALHLGASRVLVVANGRRPGELPPRREAAYPSLAQIAGHALNSIFLDTLAVDLERLHRINRTIALLEPAQLRDAGVPLRHVDVFVIYPSEPIELIAARHVASLPRNIRFLLGAVGATRRNGSNLASYLLFEAAFCRELIDLGYRDTVRRRSDLLAFFAGRAGETTPAVRAEVAARASC
jgi:NTE family protein